ncbi:MAG: transcription antitermination factor NusB [Actinomycetota bacterium]
MPRRRGVRKMALEMLYERDVAGIPLEELLESHSGDPASERAGGLVRGVEERREDIDRLITAYAHAWSVPRMPVIDRNLLRLAILELLYLADVPPAVVINEAVELAKRYSTEDSSRFVNGVLGRILDQEKSRVREAT